MPIRLKPIKEQVIVITGASSGIAVPPGSTATGVGAGTPGNPGIGVAGDRGTVLGLRRDLVGVGLVAEKQQAVGPRRVAGLKLP
jgi:hypothetical protein